ncbi:hypothetical protein CCO03_07110 [Comamonas serinivorans]|uniref:Peptidase M48 domain-containing protein n=1 Tax=Comamonas serinivorans TaxID=1082851 RepID=A0A1Y0ELF1_9BURK|nr:M48 family metallopeptidase [Comamonas serinivorans]ARU04473.1 hypothetical protein CCO03_07110 [Comamonas serinivorans]
MASYENPEVNHDVNVSAGSPLREFLSLSLWLALATVVLVGAVYLGARWLAPFLPFAWEQRMAAPVMAYWQGEATPGGDARLATQRQAWLQALADRLRPALQMPADMPVTVHWRASEDPNAFATLGGHVVIHQGLLDRVDSENAVAMVLAHEMAHVKHRDPIVALGGGLAVSLALQALLGGSGVASEAAATLSQLSFSRQQERDADAAALAALRTTYGHVADADAFFARMLCEQRGAAAPEFLQTHPDTAARLQAIRAGETASAPGQPLALPTFLHSPQRPPACTDAR